jgi:hypothetical protein
MLKYVWLPFAAAGSSCISVSTSPNPFCTRLRLIKITDIKIMRRQTPATIAPTTAFEGPDVSSEGVLPLVLFERTGAVDEGLGAVGVADGEVVVEGGTGGGAVLALGVGVGEYWSPA